MINTETSVKVKCPNCGHLHDIESALEHQYAEAMKNKLAEEKARLTAEFNNRRAELAMREKELVELKTKEDEILATKLKKEKALLESQLKMRLQKDYDGVLQDKDDQLKEVELRLRRLQQTEIENARLKRNMSQQKKELELSFEVRMNDRLSQLEKSIAERERTRVELTLKEKEKQLLDQSKLIRELQMKSEQGSSQLQGEVQELAIEEYLVQQFPFDTIEEIKKGARGADCLQHVNTRERQGCGTIYYESKRSKEFQPKWIEKLRDDMRVKSADIGVIVTQTMPPDMPRLGIRNGVWICSFSEFKGLSIVLREMVVRLAQTVDAQENKGEKMTLLYEFLTSNEFKMQIEGIVEGLMQMRDDLQRERTAMARIWSQREKQMQKVLENIAGMFGSIKGIAGASVEGIELLELPAHDE